MGRVCHKEGGAEVHLKWFTEFVIKDNKPGTMAGLEDYCLFSTVENEIGP